MTTTQGVWDNDDKTCFRIEVHAGWTWDDFKDIHTDSYALLAAENRPIDLMVVYLAQIPTSNGSFSAFSVGGKQPKNIRHTVFVNSTDLGTAMFVQSIIDSVIQINRWTGPKFVDSIEQARDYLRERNSAN